MCSKAHMMSNGCIALLGDFSSERVDVTSIGREFGWFVRQVPNFREFELAAWKTDVRVVLIHSPLAVFSPGETLRAVNRVAPDAKHILCTGLDGLSPQSETAMEQAFTVLRLPLNHIEVRHAIGFAWAATLSLAGQRARSRRIHVVSRRAGAA